MTLKRSVSHALKAVRSSDLQEAEGLVVLTHFRSISNRSTYDSQQIGEDFAVIHRGLTKYCVIDGSMSFITMDENYKLADD